MPMTMKNRMLVASLISSLSFAIPARADDAVAGFILGLAAGALGSQMGAQQAPRASGGSSKPRMSAEQREEQRRIQVVLNVVGCEAGTPDGVFGRRTTEAIRCFQAKANETVTGTLTVDQKSYLLSEYASLQNGTTTSTPNNGGGAIGIFAALDGQGSSQALAPQSPMPTPEPGPQVVNVAAAATPIPGAADVCRVQAAAAPLPGVKTPAQTAVVGDIPTVGFCELRDALMAGVVGTAGTLGMPVETALTSCQGLKGLVADDVDLIESNAPDQVILSVSKRVAKDVADIALAVDTARLCSGVAYQNNDMALAESAALFGAAVGDPSLVELLGWHLAFGLDREINRPAAGLWLQQAASEISTLDPKLLMIPQSGREMNLASVAAVLNPRTSATKVSLPGLKN